MNERMLRELSMLLPEARISIISERAWHSATFAGVRLTFEAKLQSNSRDDVRDEFAQILRKREFDLPRQIVADISVVGQTQTEGSECLIIEALILDD